MRELQTLLISCLKQERISGSMFRVLGKVVNHVVCEMFKHQDIAWDGLRDYIVSQSKTKFQRAVYIFQCLTTPLEDDEFVIHVMENLLPEIRIRLNPPRDLLVDNSCWVLAFTGAFCATIHLVFGHLIHNVVHHLKQERISDSMFKVLGKVVNHVVYEMSKHQDVAWDGLRDYIASQSKTKFQRAVYIFQCLTTPLGDDEFVIHVMENLLPEISIRLNPPRDLLVDNSCWVLAFTGAFCATIHLIEIPSQAESVKEIAKKMIDSVRELVERGMEVGLVRRAFRDLEDIVKKQMEWYETIEYKFVKGLLWELHAIKGMKWESKIVLWRINVIVERGVNEKVKDLPKDKFDWLNLPEAEGFEQSENLLADYGF